ncbi:MAG: 50S ribosomal protein L21 [Candidatus Omnitrophota bacterium]
MFAIVEVNSKQFKVSEGEEIIVPRLEAEEGKTLHIEKVLLFSDDNGVRVGSPHLKEVKVTAEVLKHFKDRKTIAFKYLRRKNRALKKGQREYLTRLKIKKIALH